MLHHKMAGVCSILMAVTFMNASSAPYLLQDSLKDLARRYRKAETASERINLLRAIAHQKTSDSVPLEEITNALATGLNDPDYDVRIATVEFLDDDQHRDVTVDKLTHALSEINRERDKIMREMSKAVKGSKKIEISMNSKKKFLDDLNRVMKSIGDVESCVEELRKLHEVECAVVNRLGQIPDDRSVTAVVKLLNGIVYGDQTTPYVEASLSLGTQKTVGAVVKVIVNWEKKARDRKRELNKLRSARPNKQTNKNLSKDAWIEKEKKRIAKAVADHEEQTTKSLRWVESVTDMLEVFASQKGLVAPPANIVPGRDWNQWFQQVREELPAELGVCTPEEP